MSKAFVILRIAVEPNGAMRFSPALAVVSKEVFFLCIARETKEVVASRFGFSPTVVSPEVTFLRIAVERAARFSPVLTVVSKETNFPRIAAIAEGVVAQPGVSLAVVSPGLASLRIAAEQAV